MQSKAKTTEEYLAEIPEDKKEAFLKLRNTILENLPKGFAEEFSYGMIGYVVPHSLYPGGYHCNPKLPLPFAYIASQKNFISLYHMGIYANKPLMDWFLTEYTLRYHKKPDIGKSCIRFKNPHQIPMDLISELMKKISVEQWISLYEQNFKKSS
jgi:uncharacterized protein YdhG (YjbR/CyaY superfamily)